MPTPTSTIVGLRLHAAKVEAEALATNLEKFKKFSQFPHFKTLSHNIAAVSNATLALKQIAIRFEATPKAGFFANDDEKQLEAIDKEIAQQRQIFLDFFNIPEILPPESKRNLLNLYDKYSLLENYLNHATHQKSPSIFSFVSQLKILKNHLLKLRNCYDFALDILKKNTLDINLSFKNIHNNINFLKNSNSFNAEDFRQTFQQHKSQLQDKITHQLLWLESHQTFTSKLSMTTELIERQGFTMSLDDAYFNVAHGTPDTHLNLPNSQTEYRLIPQAPEIIFNDNAITTLKRKTGEEKEAAIEAIQKAQPELKKELSAMMADKNEMKKEILKKSVMKKYDPETAAKLSAEQIEVEMQVEALTEQRIEYLNNRPSLFFDAYLVATNRSPEKTNYQQPKNFQEVFQELSEVKKQQLLTYYELQNFAGLTESDTTVLVEYQQQSNTNPKLAEKSGPSINHRPPRFFQKLSHTEIENLENLKNFLQDYSKICQNIHGIHEKIRAIDQINDKVEMQSLKTSLEASKSKILNSIIETMSSFSASIRENIAMYLYGPDNSEHAKTLHHLMSASKEFVMARYAGTKLARPNTHNNSENLKPGI